MRKRPARPLLYSLVMETSVRRAGLVPAWLVPTIVVALVLFASAVTWAVVKQNTGTARVPNVEGLDLPQARSRLVLAGFKVRKGDRRFSASAPKGAVLDQSPAAGKVLRSGDTVTLALSNGSERFAMPDVTGMPYQTAQDKLRALGLEVKVETVSSPKAKDLVLESFPSPNMQVSTAELVRLSVSAGSLRQNVLLPVDLTGKRFVIDPAPMPASKVGSDVPMSVARRVQALLQASGASVTLTRSSATSEGVPVAERGLAALRTAPHAVIGLSVETTGTPGFGVTILPAEMTTPQSYIASVDMARAFSQAFRRSERRISLLPAASDPVLAASKTTGVRLSLGSLSDSQDVASMPDPAWADAVAHEIYRSIASVYAPTK